MSKSKLGTLALDYNLKKEIMHVQEELDVLDQILTIEFEKILATDMRKSIARAAEAIAEVQTELSALRADLTAE